MKGFDDETLSQADTTADLSTADLSTADLSKLILPPHSHLSTKNNPAVGFTLGTFLSLLYQYRGHVSPVYLPRILFVSVMASLSSALAVVENVLTPSSTIDRVPLHPSPVFIIGAPRSGTTLLHNLLSLDTAQFSTCSTFCAGFPTSFLWFEKHRDLLSSFLSPTRPMDSMPLHFDLPQEDELGTNVLSGGVSPYTMLYFMTAYKHLLPFYRSPPPAWTTAFLFLLRKLTLRARRQNTPERLLLKSPVHTARVRHLLSIFPDAKFVHIQRNPVDVLASSIHMANTTYSYTYLSRAEPSTVLEFILSQNETLWSALDGDRELLHCGNFVEVKYEEFCADPVAGIERVYGGLGIKGGEGFKERLEREVDELRDYRKNSFRPPQALRAVAGERWGKWIRDWQY